MSSDLSRYLALRHHLRVVHHVPGRIRLRLTGGIAAGSSPQPALSAFLDRLKAAAAIRSVRVSAPTLSAVVEYDTDLMPPASWPALLSGPDEAALALLEELVASPAPV